MDSEKKERKNQSFWNRQAGAYDRRTMKVYADAYRISIEKALRVVNTDDRVLEIGCGTGIVTEGVAPHVRSILATDISAGMIEEARKKLSALNIDNVEFRVSGGEALKAPDGYFDVVLIFNTLYLVPDPVAMMRESRRLLKPGGMLVTATDCLGEPMPPLKRFLFSIQSALSRLGVIPFMHRFTKAEMRALFKANGFRIKETEDLYAAPVNYFIRAEKE